MNQRSHRKPRAGVFVVALCAGLAALIGGATSAFAETVVATSGQPGPWHVIDSSKRNGAICSYDDPGRLTSIEVLGARAFADANYAKRGQWIGWQVIIQRTRGTGAGGWVTVHTGKIRENWATGSQPAVFGPRTWTLQHPINHTFRVMEKLYWYHFSETDPQPIEASVTLRLDHYDQVHLVTDYANHPSCYGYFT
jgi:hypothetical protein